MCRTVDQDHWVRTIFHIKSLLTWMRNPMFLRLHPMVSIHHEKLSVMLKFNKM